MCRFFIRFWIEKRREDEKKWNTKKACNEMKDNKTNRNYSNLNWIDKYRRKRERLIVCTNSAYYIRWQLWMNFVMGKKSSVLYVWRFHAWINLEQNIEKSVKPPSYTQSNTRRSTFDRKMLLFPVSMCSPLKSVSMRIQILFIQRTFPKLVN